MSQHKHFPEPTGKAQQPGGQTSPHHDPCGSRFSGVTDAMAASTKASTTKAGWAKMNFMMAELVVMAGSGCPFISSGRSFLSAAFKVSGLRSALAPRTAFARSCTRRDRTMHFKIEKIHEAVRGSHQSTPLPLLGQNV